MKKKTLQTVITLLLTLCVVLACGLLELVPNHRTMHSGYGEWSLFLISELMPAIYLLHGIVSGVLLRLGASKLACFVPTVPLTFLSLFVFDLGIGGGISVDVIASVALLRSIIYGLCSLAGIALICIICAIYRSIKQNSGLLTRKYSVFKQEENHVS